MPDPNHDFALLRCRFDLNTFVSNFLTNFVMQNIVIYSSGER